ncbi:hypothetical protein N9M46_01050 [Gammaproteobacteria bacterium]|nr:hypothetical protein [Gammaproteobacteria bacterium]
METVKDSEFTNIIREFEKSIEHSPNVIKDLVKTLAALNKFGQKKGSLLRGEVNEQISLHWYTRLAAAITLVAQDKREITIPEMLMLATIRPEIAYVFNASGYRNTFHLVHICSKSAYGTTYQYDRPQMIKMLLMISIDDLPPEFLTHIESALSNIHYFILSMSWLSERAILTENGESNRTTLINQSPRFQNIVIDKNFLNLIAKVWMYCSYADCLEKHKIKEPLNNILRIYLRSKRISPKPKEYRIKQKPTILVIHESFNSNHAMYRCFAPQLRRLSQDFDLIAMAQENQIDNESNDIFSYVKKENYDAMSIEKIVEKINHLQPDIIYYPSIGMRMWVVMLANIRLAPIQITALGHPGTTKSDVIDYVAVGCQTGELTQIYSEKALRSPYYFEIERHPEQTRYLEGERATKARYSDKKVHIAINSKVMKLSHRLIAICKKINDRYKEKVVFHFLPGERGIFEDGISKKIQFDLPNAIVHPSYIYAKFLSILDQCDFALSAFPFGNTNSTVDGCLLGLPVVANFGVEQSAQTDRLVLNYWGYPDWLKTDNDEEYFKAAVRLVEYFLEDHDPKELVKIDAKDEKTLSNKGVGEEYLSNLIKYVSQNHSKIMDSDIRVINWEDTQKTKAS